ncbi:MAG: hypothetical protein WB507_04840 [Solirubrobacterales bacterium]
MLTKLREPFGTAGLIVAIVALVAALGGGAYATTHYLGATASKSKAGKPGPRGKPGPAGPTGPQGLTGPAGKEGLEGPQGKEGKQGKEGSPWTAGGTLPKGSTEKGAWAVGGKPAIDQQVSSETELLMTPISFTIPLAAGLDAEHVHVLDQGFPAPNRSACEAETGTERTECEEKLVKEEKACPGTAVSPKAEAGNLCIFIGRAENLKILVPVLPGLEAFFEAGPTGAVLLALAPEHNEGKGLFASGTWAVTAE